MIKKTLLGLALALAATSASALEWSANSFAWSYGNSFAEPAVRKQSDGSSEKIGKNILNFTHVDGYKLGGQFLSIDVLMSDSKDPAAGNSVQGATEFYAIYRNVLSFDKISGSKTFGGLGGVVRDLGVVVGGDVSAKNTQFAPHVFKPLIGLEIAFDVPGFWNVMVAAEKEWNHNGFDHGDPTLGTPGTVAFNVAPIFGSAWGIDIMKTGLEFEGFITVVLPKGKDGDGFKTKTETIIHPKLTYDVGALLGAKGYKIGVGYEYWKNKFGNDPDAKRPFLGEIRGTEQGTFLGELSIHF